jgi:hypothetical protein
MENNLFICDCHDVAHQFIFSIDEVDVLEREAILSIHLNKLSFFKRLLLGIKYIFGYQSRFGAFDEVILSETQIQRLSDLLVKKELQNVD